MSQTILHRNVVVLRVDSPAVFEEIASLLPLADYVIGTLSETERVIDPARAQELSGLLEAKGLSPLSKRGR